MGWTLLAQMPSSSDSSLKPYVWFQPSKASFYYRRVVLRVPTLTRLG